MKFANRRTIAVLLLATSIGMAAEPAAKEKAKGGATQSSEGHPYVPAIWAGGLGTLPEYAFKKVGVRSKQQLNKKLLAAGDLQRLPQG